MFRALAFAATLAAAAPAQAEMITTTVDGSFDDVAFAVESAIVGRGLVIDHVSHVGEMLERTKADVGGTATIFSQADIFLFCSASLSRKVMEADPANIQHCPYGITVMETPDAPGKIIIGHRRYPDGAMQAVQALLSEIVAEAAAD
jgi:uncharacterized protein (DUF302 family)